MPVLIFRHCTMFRKMAKMAILPEKKIDIIFHPRYSESGKTFNTFLTVFSEIAIASIYRETAHGNTVTNAAEFIQRRSHSEINPLTVFVTTLHYSLIRYFRKLYSPENFPSSINRIIFFISIQTNPSFIVHFYSISLSDHWIVCGVFFVSLL